MKTKDTEILKTLIDAVFGKEDPIPQGFRTTREWMKELGFCREKVNRMMAEGAKSGMVEKRMLTRKVSGVNRKVPYYKISNPNQKLEKKKKG